MARLSDLEREAHERQLVAAVAAERERCAKIAARAIKFTHECGDPEGWLAVNVRSALEPLSR